MPLQTMCFGLVFVFLFFFLLDEVFQVVIQTKIEFPFISDQIQNSHCHTASQMHILSGRYSLSLPLLFLEEKYKKGGISF